MKNSWRIILFWCNVLRVIRRGINFKEEEKKKRRKNRNGSRSHSYGDSVIHASVSLIRELDVEGN